MDKMKLITYCLIIFLLFSKNSFAQLIDSIHYSWEVFELEEEIEGELEPVKRCYVISKPKNTNSNYTANRDPYISVTRFRDERNEEITISSGYEYKISSKIYVLVGKKPFFFFTRGNSAWLDSAQKDKAFIQEMLKSDFVKVRSDSSLGSYSVDEYSLKGFARAYKRMKKLCQ